MVASQVVYVLLAHFVSAFIFQSDIMAQQKGKHFSWMVLHSVIYMFSLFFIMLLGMVVFENFTWSMVWRLVLINSVTYFIIDFLVSMMNVESREKKRHYFFSTTTGFEQLVHASILIYSLSYLI